MNDVGVIFNEIGSQTQNNGISNNEFIYFPGILSSQLGKQINNLKYNMKYVLNAQSIQK